MKIFFLYLCGIAPVARDVAGVSLVLLSILVFLLMLCEFGEKMVKYITIFMIICWLILIFIPNEEGIKLLMEGIK